MPEDPGEPVEKQAYLVAPGRSRLFKSPCCFSNSLTQCSTFFFPLCHDTIWIPEDNLQESFLLLRHVDYGY